MASPALRHFLPRFGAAAAAASFLSLAGCQLGSGDPETVLPVSGHSRSKGWRKMFRCAATRWACR